MAKLNWQKVHTQSLMQSARENEWQDARQAKIRQRNTRIIGDKYWHIGKNKGMQVKSLPLNYLCYVSENFDDESPYKKRADNELRRRYRESNTQG